MNFALTSLLQHLRKMRMAYLVLLLSLIPTAVVYNRVKSTVETRDRARFERVVREAHAAIEQRIPHYIDEMMGLRGLFAANASVNAEQWQQYVASIQIQTQHPGIRTLGYLERVDANEKEAFLARARLTNWPSHILPAGDRPVYFPAVFLNHFDPELNGAPGADHFADPQRQPAMELARDTGEAKATAKVTLTGGSATNRAKSGFVIYLPVYRGGVPPATLAERRAALEGFIFANFESERLLRSELGAQASSLVACKIYDGTNTTSEHLLFGEGDEPHGSEHRSHQHVDTQLRVLNRTWTLAFDSLPAFEAESQQNLPLIALICWLTLSFLLFGITYAQVSAREKAEEMSDELLHSETALAAEKERLAVTLYSIGDGVITTDTEGNVLSINKVAEQLTGWRQPEALGKPLAALFNLVDENSRQPCASPLATALKTGAVCSLDKPLMLIAKDGQERIIADSAAPIRNRAGGIIGAVVVFRDITAKQKSEAEFLKESKLESVGLLAGGIAHDFNNILQGIIGNLSLARMNSNSAEKMLERLGAVEKSAMRAKDLTQQLVMFARGGAPIRKRMQLTGLIKDAAMFALQGGNAHGEFTLAADSWPVEVDQGQFRQVINNMIVNAIQALPEGGKIEVRLENVELTEGFLPPLNAGKYVKISIRDYGEGIRPENLPRIFDPYFTTRKFARGLGLASAYSVVRKHDGQITVESRVGRGTTFQIYLPASPKAADAPPVEGEGRRFFGEGRILVMDDEPVLLLLVREMLELMGYEVETAADGAEALQRYLAAKRAGTPFAAVIMDLTVPEGMGGKEAIRRLRELDPQVKAIVSSGYSYDPVMANFREYGFSGVMPKPYVMEELGRVLEEVIGSKEKAPAGSGG